MREMKDSGVETIQFVPQSWRYIRLKHLCKVQTGNEDTQNADPEGEYPFYVRSPKQERCCRYTFEGEGILVAGDGAGAGRTFHHAFGKYAVHQRVYILSDFKFAPRFVYLFLSNLFPYDMDRGSAQSTVPSIRQPMLLNFPLFLPKEEEAINIIEYLDTKAAKVDALIANVQAQIEKLKAYKQSLITEVVTKGLDPTVPMKDSGVEWIGDVPVDWQIIKFKYIATIKSNLVNPALYLDYPQVSPENIEKGAGKLLQCQTVKEVGVESYNHLFFSGQIIYSKVRPILNKVVIAPFDGLCSADMYPIETAINKNYLLYFMLSNIFLSQVKLVTENRVKMPKINQEEISRIIVCCPPNAAQEEIVIYLDKKCAQIVRLIAIKQAKIEKLEQYKRSLIYEYVTGKKEVRL